jgi:hypothetical protein
VHHEAAGQERVMVPLPSRMLTDVVPLLFKSRTSGRGEIASCLRRYEWRNDLRGYAPDWAVVNYLEKDFDHHHDSLNIRNE